jgi:hypothetical protein
MISSILVSYDDQPNDEPILIVGKKRMNQSVEIINAFQGMEASAMYRKLTEQPKEVKRE